jgi:hypothetical protein
MFFLLFKVFASSSFVHPTQGLGFIAMVSSFFLPIAQGF